VLSSAYVMLPQAIRRSHTLGPAGRRNDRGLRPCRMPNGDGLLISILFGAGSFIIGASGGLA
jgi:hypothetical protein